MFDKVLTHLQQNNITVRPDKCEWAVRETNFKGYCFIPSGLKQWPKKVEDILNLDEPRTLKQLHAFVEMVHFYRLFYQHRAHIMAPLTNLNDLPKSQQCHFLCDWTEVDD